MKHAIAVYIAAVASLVMHGSDNIMVFTNYHDTFTIQSNAVAKVLVVGGGGAGGSMPSTDVLGIGAGGGGGGGGVSYHDRVILSPGTYEVHAGRGGQKVQTTVDAWIGDNGDQSWVRMGGTNLFAALGGGGGGTAKLNGDGQDGGSGGGGSWYNGLPTVSGGHVDGQGWNGGKASSANQAGGGGGAATEWESGNGGSDGSAGRGRTIGITGSDVVYGQGGRGGSHLTDSQALDGSGYGFGGNGANATGCGGAGGDGVVIVAIEKFFSYSVVDVPEPVSFEWVDGQEYVEFNLEESDLRDAVDYVEGTTNVLCSVVNSATNGLGRFHYTLHLKDEYMWSDGSVNAKTIYWRVKEKGTIGVSTIDVTKTVEWSSGKDAIIAINIKTTPEMLENTPNVLFVGSVCNAHGFSADVFNAAIDAITAVGNVDFHLFSAGAYTNSVDRDSRFTEPSFSGSLVKGQSLSSSQLTSLKKVLAGGNHGTLYQFYEQLSRAMASGSRYDYIVFSFDGGLAATMFPESHADENAVAEWLTSFYDSGSVIWMLSDQSEETVEGVYQNPWRVCPIAHNSAGWWMLDYYVGTWGHRNQKSGNYGYDAYRAMLGLFAPNTYLTNCATASEYGAEYNMNAQMLASSSSNISRARRLQADEYTVNQVVYDNASNVSEMVKSVVKVRPGTIMMTDSVCTSMGLEVDQGSTYGQWTTNEDAVGWIDLVDGQIEFNETGVNLRLDGITDPCEIRLYIAVEDTGSFRSSVGATFNEQTGKWEKDPNDGPVEVSISSDDGETILDEAQASTAVAWSFPTYNVSGSVVHGLGEIVINGFITNSVNVASGTSPEVVFRGSGGYVLDYLNVDGMDEDFDENTYSWHFIDVSADHDVKVGFTSVMDETSSPGTAPRVETYDGSTYGISVTNVVFIDGYEDLEWHVVYSVDPDGEFTTTGGVVSVKYDSNGDPMPQTVYAKIVIHQPGYGTNEYAVLENWIGTNTVTILPRDIVVQYDDYVQTNSTRKTDGFSYSIVDGILVDGDVLVQNGGTCTSYPELGEHTSGSVTSNGCMEVSSPNGSLNYRITVIPGDYYYPDIELVANAPSVTKVYDGIQTGTTAYVVYPSDARTREVTSTEFVKKSSTSFGTSTYTSTNSWSELKILYSADGGTTYAESTPPQFTDAGTNIVHYMVTYSTSYEVVTKKRRSTMSWTYTYTTGSVQKVEYAPYYGTASVTILPRPVYLNAGSSERLYNGMPLVNGEFTIEPATDTTGFVGTDGLNGVVMTDDSVQVDAGTHANTIDINGIGRWTFVDGTKPGNYSFIASDGTLTVIGGVSLMIVDHRSVGCASDFVDLCVKVQHNGIPSFNGWIAENITNFAAKTGSRLDEMEKSSPVSVQAVEFDLDGSRVWIRVPMSAATNFYARAFYRGIGVPWKHSNGHDILDHTCPDIGGVESINIHAAVKVTIPTTNTMVAIPWTWYSELEQDAESIPVKKLVSMRNMDDSNMIYVPVVDNDTYAAWMVESVNDDSWTPVDVIRVDGDGFGRMKFKSDDDSDSVGYEKSTRIARGYGMWLARRNPVDSGTGEPLSIWLYGQNATNDVVSTASAPTGTNTVCSTMIGNPFGKAVVLNEMDFNGTVDSMDRIKYHDENGINKDLLYISGRGWREYTTVIVNGKKRNGYTYCTEIPAGIAFWYDRRGKTNDVNIGWSYK